MPYQGDIRLGATIEFTFTTRRFSTGAPYALAGTPSIEAYQTGSSTPITSGVTLTTDYSGVTGLNHVSIAATSGNGFATAKDVSVVIAAGTVDSVSVVGETVGSFSIENRSAVMPTTSGRTLDISAGGEAGVDWANVGSPTTSNALTGTTIATTQKVDVETIKTQAVTCAGGVTFPAATLASTTNITTASGVALAAAGLDSIVIETGLNARQALSVIAAACAGVSDGAGTSSIVFSGAGVAATRIDATVSTTSGERTAVTLTPPA